MKTLVYKKVVFKRRRTGNKTHKFTICQSFGSILGLPQGWHKEKTELANIFFLTKKLTFDNSFLELETFSL